MNKSSLVKKATIYMAIFFVVIFLIGMVFFRKDNNNIKENNLKLDDQQLIEEVEDEEITEEEKAKSFAKNFVEVYNTYMINDFSNIELLKDNMTQSLWERESQWIETRKEKTKDNPKRYIVFNAQTNKADIIYFDNSEMVIEIEYEQFEIRGTSIYMENILTDVDEFGEITLVQIPIKSETKKVMLKLIKKGDEWKVDNIEIVKNQDQN